jgi:hypothetical protein
VLIEALILRYVKHMKIICQEHSIHKAVYSSSACDLCGIDFFIAKWYQITQKDTETGPL